MNKRMYIWGSALVAVVLCWLGAKAYQASRNLVTLDVHNADVRDVIRKIEWQTWETIVVNKDVKGKVTLDVTKVPMEEVLGTISEQVSARAMAVYPIYSKGNSFVNLRKLARGDVEHEAVGWTNFFTGFGRGGGRGGPGGPGGFGGFGGGGGGPGPGGFGGPDSIAAQDAPVSLSAPGKDLMFATLALSRRFSGTQVIPEDGATATVTLQLDQVPFSKAVARVAKQAGKKWDVFYTLQDRPDFFARNDGEDRGGRRGGNGGNAGDGQGFRGRGFFGEGDTNSNWNTNWEARAEERSAQRERETEIRLATMTPQEQQQAQEQQKQFESMRDMTDEQRRQAFEQMRNNPQNQQRFENRRVSMLNNSSPEQRSQRTQRVMEMRARRQNGQGGGGGGYGGRGR